MEKSITGDYGERAVELLFDLTLQSVVAAREALIAEVKHNSRLLIRLHPEAVVDLAGVQLLEAARKSASAVGGEVALADPAAGGLRETLSRGGFLESPQQRQFWLKQEE